MSDVAIVGPGGVKATMHDDGSITYPVGAGPTGRRAEGGQPALPPSMRKSDDELGIPDEMNPSFPMHGYENTPKESPLVHEDPIGDVIVGNAVAGGLPKLLEAAGARLGQAGAAATTRLAAKTAEEEAARIAARETAPAVPESPVRKLAGLVEHAVDLHHPLKPVVNAAARVAESPVDRLLASPTVSRAASAAQSAGSGTHAASYLMYLLGHGVDAPVRVPPQNLLMDLATAGVNK